MNKRNIEAVYPLSPMQEGMLFHSLHAPESGVYFEQLYCTLRGNLSETAFRQAWQSVVDRHSILRTSFVWKNLDKILQVVHKHVPLPYEIIDWRHVDPDKQPEALQAFLTTDRRTGFNLAKPPLLRLTLIQIDTNAWHFVCSHHHTILDGWSLPLLIKEVFSFYKAYSAGLDVEPEPVRPYRDFISWLKRQDTAAAEAFWRGRLKGFTAPTPILPEKKSNNAPGAEQAYHFQSLQFSPETTSALMQMARSNRITLNTIAQGAWAVLLSRYSGEEDIVFGTTVSGRPADLAGADRILGLFINTLPMRVLVPSAPIASEWLQALFRTQTEMQPFDYSPLVNIQEWSQVPRGTPLFDSILVFENYPVDASLRDVNRLGDLEIENLHTIEQTNYPLTVAVVPDRSLTLKIGYDGRLFSADAIERMLGHMQTLLTAFGEDSGRPLAELPMLTNAEKRKMVVEWNNTAADYPRDLCVHEIFEDQVRRNHEAIALIFEDQEISYAELNRRANQLAHHLREFQVGPEVLVGICTDRSPEMITAILATLKAGGAYLPLDPTYPPERLAYMIEDSRISVLLTQQHLLQTLPDTVHRAPCAVLCLDTDWPSIAQHSDQNPYSEVTPDNLAYVIYTSGSTGRPKGTMLAHKGLSNLTAAQRRSFGIEAGSRVLQFSPFSFDASVWEIFMALANGGTLVLARQEVIANAIELAQLMETEAVTNVTLPPSVLRVLPQQQLAQLQTIIVAGEKCTVELVEGWAEGRQFFNAYGPTETTVCASMKLCPPELTDDPSIGRPIANGQLYVQDRYGHPVPVGVSGELCVGGVSVARGYWQRPEMTADKFVPDPFSDLPGMRLYRTGDLVRYLPDGEIDFLGRIDDQVKVRGFRIELGEVEAELRQLDGVREAVVTATADRLNAYAVVDVDPAPSADQFRADLRKVLPDYMVPSVFTFMDRLPLTPSGKVDRKCLPHPDTGRSALESVYEAPRTPVEEMLVNIWSHVLGVERVGINDNFYDLGGHSLLATQLVSRIRRVFQCEIPLRKLFEHPSVAEMAELLQKNGLYDQELLPAITTDLRDEGTHPPLSFAQQRLWFLEQLKPGNLFYNIPAAVRLTGTLDADALHRSFNEIVRRHEILRTTFADENGIPVQVIAAELELPLPIVDLRHQPASERENEALRLASEDAQTPFNLAQGPISRAKLLRLKTDEHILIFTIHHIVADGWSVGVILREMGQLYAAFAAQKPSPLPALSIQYADYALWQRKWLHGKVLERQLDYWKKQLSGTPPLLELPLDHPRPPVQSSQGATLAFDFSAELAQGIRKLSQSENVTLFMTLLTAFKTLLFRYTGQTDICIGTPIANRRRAAVENLIGFFVNTLVLRSDLSGNPAFKDLLKRLREVTLDAYAHQDLPFELLVEALQPQRDLSHTPFFQVMFVMNTALPGELQLPELTMSPIELDKGTSTFDLTIQITETEENIRGYIEYNTDLFEENTIERMAGHFHTLLEAIVKDPTVPIATVALMPEHERRQALIGWNDTERPFPVDACVHHLFEGIAAAHPKAIALKYRNRCLSYDELNRRANQLAHYLQKQAVGPEVLVGISTERSIEMIVGILAVLKAGGAYLPLAPNYPPERLAFMLQDSRIPLLLSQKHLHEHLADSLKDSFCSVLFLDEDWEKFDSESEENPICNASAANMAYVIYTSGSTGKPKGTVLCHRGLCNLTLAQRRAFNIRRESCVLQFSPFSFDASVWETFMALCNGATLCLAPQADLSSGQRLVELLHNEGVTNVTLPPSMLAVMPVEELPLLETIISAGEACTADLVSLWARGRDFFNAYGPTETTVCASMFLCDPESLHSPPIGRPIDNTRLYILDSNLQPLPVGVPGELHVGGVSLARGYLNRPDLTEERFIPDPFSGAPDARLYKTGDLVRYRSDGNIEYLGRIDHQVKVRGFRIELGEIETVLSRHPMIREAAVIVREDSPVDKRLTAYFVPENAFEGPADPKELDIGALQSFLKKSLPDYMVPTAFVGIDRMPLSPSGKIDRKGLPEPDRRHLILAREYAAPRNPTEKQLTEICAELLGVERVGIHDNFFELGGHSLLATQLVSRIRDEMHADIPLQKFFEYPHIAALAEYILQLRRSDDSPADRIGRLLQKVEEMSEEEVQALLHEKAQVRQVGKNQ